MRRALAAAILVLAACQVGAEDGTADGPRPDPEAQAECEAAGGTYGRFGLFPGYLCQMPTPDAGKPCTRATDCTGMCLAETRTCSPVTPMFGCHAILAEEGAEVTICID